MNIAENITALRKEIPDQVKIIAVSKTMSAVKVMEAYRAGQRLFGENKVQELLKKQPLLPADVEWHFIGHLQTNKVKLVVPLVRLIHSVDSEKLLWHIDKEGQRLGKRISCLLQVKIAREESKYGMEKNDATQLLNTYLHHKFSFVEIRGLMGMATLTKDQEQISKEFAFLAACYHELKQGLFAQNEAFQEISMGMSGDYRIALENGSTMVRIGSLIFGERIHDPLK